MPHAPQSPLVELEEEVNAVDQEMEADEEPEEEGEEEQDFDQDASDGYEEDAGD